MPGITDMIAGILQQAEPQPQRSPYGAPPSVMDDGSYQTKLDPLREAAFQSWVQRRDVPFDPSQNADYDMRGFWRALQQGDPRAQTSMNANDGQLHYPDTWKTPYHESFSNESKFAMPGAPAWNNRDQLVTPRGRVVFDEPRRERLRRAIDMLTKAGG